MQPSTCACERCAAMCANSVCIPTPDEARELVRRGYGPRLARYRFGSPASPLEAVAPAQVGREGQTLSMTTGGRCTFHNDGLCELHDLGIKPLEGRLAHHDKPWLPVRMAVMRYWSAGDFAGISALIPAATARPAAAMNAPTSATDQTQKRTTRI